MRNNSVLNHGHRSNILKYRKQIIFMLGAVVLNFFVCLLPFRALTLWIIIVPTETIMSLGIEGYYKLIYFCRVMLYLNSAMNPILYNLMSSKFREGFLKLLRCKSMRSKKFKSGIRKETFHTISTNLSSSFSGDRRNNTITEIDRRKRENFVVINKTGVLRSSNGSSVRVITKRIDEDCENCAELVC